MPATAEDYKKEKDPKDKQYLVNYVEHLEKRIRKLENEKQLIDNQRFKLEKELHDIRNEIDLLREPPLITATIMDVLDEHEKRVIIKSSTGPDFVVHKSRNLKTNKLDPGMQVALNQRTYAIMEILPTNLDPFVKGMEMIDSIPDISYKDVGGLEEQIQEVKENT